MSRFVSGGTNEEPTERDSAWLAAQAELDAAHAAKAAQAHANDGKSLYETLQANKAAKQDAFEESIKLRNQFQSLDEDDVEFLDSVLEGERKKEAEVKRETREQLEAFRRQREEAEANAREGGEDEAPKTTESWAVSRKRKKGREDALGGVKLRKASSGAKAATASAEEGGGGEKTKVEGEAAITSPAAAASKSSPETSPVADPAKPQEKVKDPASTEDNSKSATKPSASPPPTSLLGLAAYSSDEDD